MERRERPRLKTRDSEPKLFFFLFLISLASRSAPSELLLCIHFIKGDSISSRSSFAFSMLALGVLSAS